MKKLLIATLIISYATSFGAVYHVPTSRTFDEIPQAWKAQYPNTANLPFSPYAADFVPLVQWTNATPDGMTITNRTYVISDGVATEVVEYGPIVVTVPESVTPRQIRMALRITYGVTPEAIEAMLMQIENTLERDLALIEWRTANTVRRDHQMIDSMGEKLELDSDEIDALFIQAQGYE